MRQRSSAATPGMLGSLGIETGGPRSSSPTSGLRQRLAPATPASTCSDRVRIADAADVVAEPRRLGAELGLATTAGGDDRSAPRPLAVPAVPRPSRSPRCPHRRFRSGDRDRAAGQRATLADRPPGAPCVYFTLGRSSRRSATLRPRAAGLGALRSTSSRRWAATSTGELGRSRVHPRRPLHPTGARAAPLQRRRLARRVGERAGRPQHGLPQVRSQWAPTSRERRPLPELGLALTLDPVSASPTTSARPSRPFSTSRRTEGRRSGCGTRSGRCPPRRRPWQRSSSSWLDSEGERRPVPPHVRPPARLPAAVQGLAARLDDPRRALAGGGDRDRAARRRGDRGHRGRNAARRRSPGSSRRSSPSGS